MAAVMKGDGQPLEPVPDLSLVEGLSSVPGPATGETAIPRQAIIGWLEIVDADIAKTVAELRLNRPNILAHPLQRLRYVGAVAVQAGKRQVVNYMAERLMEQPEREG